MKDIYIFKIVLPCKRPFSVLFSEFFVKMQKETVGVGQTKADSQSPLFSEVAAALQKQTIKEFVVFL